MISRFAIDMAQELRIDSENAAELLCTNRETGGLSPAPEESRRQLMWSCFLINEVTKVANRLPRLNGVPWGPREEAYTSRTITVDYDSSAGSSG